MDSRTRHRLLAAALPAVLAAFMTAPGHASSAAASSGSVPATLMSATAPAGVDDWPTFHHDAGRGGVSAETAIGASNAASLALSWSQPTGGSDCPCSSYSSPTVAYNPTLGESLVYVGNQQGDLSAFNAATGGLVWRYSLPTRSATWQSKNIEGTPAVSTANNAVYFGASDGMFYELNATTGDLDCTFNTDIPTVYAGGRIAASPLIEDGVMISGVPTDVAYFGDNGQSGNVTLGGNGGNEWAVNVTPGSGSSGNCPLIWRIGPFPLGSVPPSGQLGAGSYTSPAWATDQNGNSLVIFGTTDPDDQIYAVNAATGTDSGGVGWHFQTVQGYDSDVGAAATISAPGVNGFAGGVVYDTGKDGNVYALNLTTGALIWQYALSNNHPAQSTAALVGDTLYEGYGGGEIALNATTSTVVWNNTSVPLNISSPAVSGAPGNQVLLFGDLTGASSSSPTPSALWGLRLSDGSVVFHSVPDPTDSTSFFYASPAVSTGRVFISGTDGNLYAYAPRVSPSSTGGGYSLDAFGGIHPFGDSPAVTATAYWPGWDIARAIALNPCDSSGQISGWVMDGFGGLHPFAAAGTPMPAVPDITGYWPGWTIANDVAAFCINVNNVQHAAGCVLDGFGGLHPWADSSAVIGDVSCMGTGYWPGWDIATKITVIPGTDEGYVMDGFGGLHPFNGAQPVTPSGYWPGWTIARDVVATADGAGYTVDGFGGIHPFGSAPAITSSAYWPGWDIVRGIDLASGGTGVYVLDGFGGVHPAGGAPSLSVTGYWPGWAVVRDFITAP